MITKVFDTIERKRDEYKQLLVQMVGMETPSRDKAALDALAAELAEFCAKQGFSVRTQAFEKAGNGLVITMNEQSTLPAIAFMGHMDTVFEKGAFGYPPVREENGILYGPGVYDMKGGIVISLLAMKSLMDCGYKERPLKLVLISDEEISESLSGEEGIDFLCRETKNCAAAINYEGSSDNKVTVGHRGSMRLKVNVKGKAAHAAARYNEGINAIKEAAHKIIKIEEKSDSSNITYNCGVIQGGTVPNIVPENCWFIVDVRYPRKDLRETAYNHVLNIVGTSFLSGTTSTMEEIAKRPPFERSDRDMELFNYINDISCKYKFGELKAVFGSGGTDSCYSSAVGTPSVSGMGIKGGKLHTTEEYAIIQSMVDQAKLITAIVLEFSAGHDIK